MRPYSNAQKILATIIFLFCFQITPAQEKLTLTDLSVFRQPTSNWKIVGDVQADLNKANELTTRNGTGVLVNQPQPSAKGQLVSVLEHGDLDIELDYMMAKESNSGIYLQGKYEVQLLDSWGVLQPRSQDNGGIYERWDDRKSDGKKGFEGTAPRQNVSKAPGLWQHLKISFQAPKFEAGKKIANAKILSVELNGVLIQENVELSGPTRSPLDTNETASAPFMIQGDHGPVAFRNIIISNYNKGKPSIKNVLTTAYKGKYVMVPDYAKLKPIAQQSSQLISSNVSGIPANEFLLKYTATLQVTEAGRYHFKLNTFGGGGELKINKQIVIPFTNWNAEGTVQLSAGDNPVELVYSKYVDWAKPSLAMQVDGPGIRTFTITDTNIPASDDADPIEVKAVENKILRSFVDIPSGRVTHAINVGSPEKIHYTYDMDHGMIVQAWRGEFLDATPMWHERGDGSSRAAGAVLPLGKMEFMLKPSLDNNDTTGAAFRTKGYTLDAEGRPSFQYMIYGDTINDVIRVKAKGMQREISVRGSHNVYAVLVSAKNIEEKTNGQFIINDKSFYLVIDDAGGQKPVIKDNNGIKELIVSVKQKIVYSLIF